MQTATHSVATHAIDCRRVNVEHLEGICRRSSPVLCAVARRLGVASLQEHVEGVAHVGGNLCDKCMAFHSRETLRRSIICAAMSARYVAVGKHLRQQLVTRIDKAASAVEGFAKDF